MNEIKKKDGFGDISKFLKKHIGLEVLVFILTCIYVVSLLLTPYFMGKAIDLAFDKVYVADSPELKTATYHFLLDI